MIFGDPSLKIVTFSLLRIWTSNTYCCIKQPNLICFSFFPRQIVEVRVTNLFKIFCVEKFFSLKWLKSWGLFLCLRDNSVKLIIIKSPECCMTTVDDGSYMFGPQVWNIAVNQLGNLLEKWRRFFWWRKFYGVWYCSGPSVWKSLVVCIVVALCL
jgi:hypothetical protein